MRGVPGLPLVAALLSGPVASEEAEAKVLVRWVAMWRAESKPTHPAWHNRKSTQPIHRATCAMTAPRRVPAASPRQVDR